MFSNNLIFFVPLSPIDGTAAKFLWNNARSIERCKKWSAVVQNQYQIGKVVLWSQWFWQITEDSETIASVVSSNWRRTHFFYSIFQNNSYFFQTDDGEDDLKKGTQLLEIYALEIQMYTVQKNNKKLKALYEQSLHIKSAIPHPLIMGVIRG